jgi:signal transduction histidine kinase
MYSEMLAEKMVTDEEKRTRYLKTLQAEAARLSHLVENVLAYARLEGNRSGGHIEKLALGELVNRTTERLSDRARHANMELRIAVRADDQRRMVQADVGAVEQILFNLVDNACKYAAKAADRTVLIDAWATGEWAVLRVCDHGPGISKADRARLFQPFSKSAHQAAHTAPGVGLGLALSRRLARQMGGDLLNADHTVDGGACFQLTLPAV